MRCNIVYGLLPVVLLFEKKICRRPSVYTHEIQVQTEPVSLENLLRTWYHKRLIKLLPLNKSSQLGTLYNKQ